MAEEDGPAAGALADSVEEVHEAAGQVEAGRCRTKDRRQKPYKKTSRKARFFL